MAASISNPGAGQTGSIAFCLLAPPWTWPPISPLGRLLPKGEVFMVSLLSTLWVFWGSITVALAGLLIYRSLVAMKEEDQLFLDPAEWQFEKEQRAILTQLRKLTPLIRTLAFVSAALLALIAGIWIYRGVLGVTDSTFK
jgi:hypothetical protein